jgi:hypothetical protein
MGTSTHSLEGERTFKPTVSRNYRIWKGELAWRPGMSALRIVRYPKSMGDDEQGFENRSRPSDLCVRQCQNYPHRLPTAHHSSRWAHI